MTQPLPFLYIESREALEQGIKYLDHAEVIGVDTEGDSLHSYQEKVSLIQISGNHHDLIIDPLALGDLSPLAGLLSKPDIVKVLHGTDYDVVVLKRDFGFQISPLFDTCLAARACGIPKYSLADLLNRYFGVSADKRYQKADWSARPLPQKWLEYAAVDTHYLPQLYQVLKTELEVKGRLEMVEEECQLLTRREWTGKPFEPSDYLRIKGITKLSDQAQRVARALAIARDQMAQRLNRPVFKVLSNQDLLLMANKQPRTDQELAALFPRPTHSIRRRAVFWFSAIRQGFQDRSPLPSPPNNRGQSFSPAQQTLFQRLREWRDAQARAEGVEPAMILSAHELRQLVQVWPKTSENLAQLPFLRRWQVNRYGKDLIAQLNLTISHLR